MIKSIRLAGALAFAVATSAFAQQVPTGLHGIKIAVADYARTTQFYSILGMTAGTKYNPMEWELRWTDPARGVAIIMVHDDSGRIPVVKGGASLMISVADVPATVTRLKAAGFAVPGVPNVTPRATIMMIKDPDGNSIELLGGPFGSGAAAPAH
ncbi:MAG: Glyoxalase/Bleomycin resistance protein/Dioxygenase superfamily [Novosphingobium sp.]|nr:Glyoxalase/Bleomycin resistance protein/Dioxygenase superfamily [Novosphingobium sp.]